MSKTADPQDWIFTRTVTKKMFEQGVSAFEIIDAVTNPSERLHQQDDESDDIFMCILGDIAVIVNDAEKVVITFMVREVR